MQHGRLTLKQAEVLRHLAKGLTARQVGNQMGISEHTVKNHMRLIYVALGVHSRTEAAVWAAQNGLVES